MASLDVSINSYLNCFIDKLVHQYEEIWSPTKGQDSSQCLTGLLELSRLDLTSFTRMRLNWLDQKNIVIDEDHLNIKIVAVTIQPLVCMYTK